MDAAEKSFLTLWQIELMRSLVRWKTNSSHQFSSAPLLIRFSRSFTVSARWIRAIAITSKLLVIFWINHFISKLNYFRLPLQANSRRHAVVHERPRRLQHVFVLKIFKINKKMLVFSWIWFFFNKKWFVPTSCSSIFICLSLLPYSGRNL